MKNDSSICIVCKRDSEETPLLAFQYKGSGLFICPRHLPILIHDPVKLAEVLPGAETLEPADHHD